ncbi:MAG: hypothetical protein NTX86_02395 [Candidatus Dependentiae bacterium]|nr:hypothetical protein [Candidatus Dependentiae bacterium]
MNQMLKKLFSAAVLLSTPAFCSQPANTPCAVAPQLLFRSQAVDAARELAGWAHHVNLFDQDKIYGSLSATVEYSQSFRSSRIAECLFGTNSCNNDCGATIKVSGSDVAERGANDWLADYFYLPTDFQSTLHFSPKIQNVVADLNFYLGLDEWACGLFFRMHAPINWTKWCLNYCETVTDAGVADYQEGYFTVSVDPRSNLLNNFSEFAAGKAPAVFNDTDASSTGTADVTFDGLCYAKFDRCCRTKTRLADLSWILGYNFVNDEDYHLGVGIKVAAPTGNRPSATHLFDAVSGNGHHWELGAHITSHAMLWRCEDEDSSLGFYLDANITHLFNDNQTRTFDLKGKPLSRYMLAAKHTAPAVGLFTDAAATTLAATQFAREFSPVANLTTRDVSVSIGVQGDVAAQLTYANRGWNVDLGYNFWGRSCEKFSRKDCSSDCRSSCSSSSDCKTACAATFAENTWALKGEAHVFGFHLNPAGDADALTVSDSNATINSGTVTSSANLEVNHAANGYNGANSLLDAQISVPTEFITECDLDLVGTRGISNKVYGHLSYNWLDCEDWAPYVGIGGFGEFGSNSGSCNTGCSSSSDCNTGCSSSSSSDCKTTCASSSSDCNTSSNCHKCALSQWGVWIKAGVSFN